MSAELHCSGTPISWLRLEIYGAGEGDATERERIAAHLATCAACAACVARIESDAELPLPSLPALPSAPARVERPARPRILLRIAPPLAALALAAALLLILGRRPTTGAPAPDQDPSSARMKGGDVGFVLVRDDEGVVAEAGGIYRDGDRWKALVTCPAGMRAAWDLAVFERGEAAFPLEPALDLPCGNAVPLPGAFRTTGKERLTVCLVWNDGALVDRNTLRGASPAAIPHSTCKVLDPAP
jgi:hypothetical protein